MIQHVLLGNNMSHVTSGFMTKEGVQQLKVRIFVGVQQLKEQSTQKTARWRLHHSHTTHLPGHTTRLSRKGHTIHTQLIRERLKQIVKTMLY